MAKLIFICTCRRTSRRLSSSRRRSTAPRMVAPGRFPPGSCRPQTTSPPPTSEWWHTYLFFWNPHFCDDPKHLGSAVWHILEANSRTDILKSYHLFHWCFSTRFHFYLLTSGTSWGRRASASRTISASWGLLWRRAPSPSWSPVCTRARGLSSLKLSQLDCFSSRVSAQCNDK